ncbi:MAG: thioredoxin domain-containing protein [Myxococcota bacterium]
MSKGTSMFLVALLAAASLALGCEGKSDEVVEVEAADVEIDEDVERYKVPVGGQPSKGPDDALVTIVEFSEFQCPFCARVLPTVKQIQDTYGDDVRIVWRNLPLGFHQNADPAAQLAMEAYAQGGNDKFWEVHDLLFENQKALSRADLENYAQQAGLDMDKVKKALDEKAHAEAIKEDSTLAATMGARGTPNFFVNGRNVRGAVPFASFQKVIDEELATAKALQEQGVTNAQMYATLTKNGLEKAAPPKPQQRPGQPDPSAVYKVPLQGDEPQKGPDDALITIVEFSDFECPFCGRVEPTLTALQEKYGDDLRVVWMNNPLGFHKNAKPAATAALEAYDQKGDEGFWAMHEKMFQNQRALTSDNLEKFAKEIGLDMKKFKAALEGDKYKDTINKQQVLSNKLGARGTPAFFINGRNLRGAQPQASFEIVIEEELKKAKALVDGGTPRSKVYETSIAKGLEAPKAAPAAAKPDANKVYNIPKPKNAPTKGASKAKVIIQEYSDFQCPFCGRVNPTMAQVMDEYGDEVQVIWRNYPLPFHKDAHLAAQASLEVYEQKGNKGFWEYHDILFENQKALTRPNLEKYAAQIGGINMKKFKQALDSEKHKASVDADIASISKAGARIGTPSFFINGKLVQGAQPYAAFKAAIDEQLNN